MSVKKVVLILCGVAVFVLLLVIGFAFSLFASNNASVGTSTVAPSWSASAPNVVVEPALRDLHGKWIAQDNDMTFTADVVDDSITVKMVKNNSSMLYWYGSFSAHALVNQSVTSNRLDINKAVASSANSKEFVVGKNTLTFEITALGMTKNVELSHA